MTKPKRCFCGSKVCTCEQGGYWRVHCMTCDWQYGGSSQTLTEEEAIREWNRPSRKKKT